MSDRLSLREIRRDNLRAVCDLAVQTEQLAFVAPNVFSIAQAYTEPQAWPRAIYAGETPVGFLMLREDRQAGQYFLWRLMIDGQHQGKGYARAALDLLVEHVRGLPGAVELRSSYVAGEAGPAAFYRAYGFADTGERMNEEVVIRLVLQPAEPQTHR